MSTTSLREPPTSPARPLDPHAEAIAMFDRFLLVFADANRRFGNLFPYNHLRVRVQAMLAGKVARVTIRDPLGAPLGVVAVGWRDGELRRVPEGGEPAFAWTVPLALVERVVAEPWSFLARPGRLEFAWFPGPAQDLHAEALPEPLGEPATTPAAR